jgi:hypothetical protein
MCDLAGIAALDAAEGAHGPARIVATCADFAGSMRRVGRDGPVDMARFKAVIRVNLPGTASVMTRAAARISVLDRMTNGGDRQHFLENGLRGSDRSGCLCRLQGCDCGHA